MVPRVGAWWRMRGSMINPQTGTALDPGQEIDRRAAQVETRDDVPHDLAREIESLRRLEVMLDRKFKLPVVGSRFGLDGLVGLIPGVGDAVTGVGGAYFFYKGAKLGVRKRVLGKMALNTLLDFGVGSIPLLGDVLDFAFRSNTRNLKLILDEVEGRRPSLDAEGRTV